MIYSAVDLCIEIDFGSNEPGAVLQYEDRGYWYDYLVDGKPVVNLCLANCKFANRFRQLNLATLLCLYYPSPP